MSDLLRYRRVEPFLGKAVQTMSLCRYYQCKQTRPSCQAAALLITRARKYVHVKCLQKWRVSSHSNNSFWRCPQCHFHYRFARTKAYGLGTNPGKCHCSSPSIDCRLMSTPSRRRLLVVFFVCPFGHVFVICHKLFPRLDRGAVHVRNDVLFCLPT